MAPLVLCQASAKAVSRQSSSAKDSNVVQKSRSMVQSMTGALLSQTLAVKMAGAEEAMTFTPPQVTIPESTVSVATDGGIGDLISDNPLLLVGAGAILAVPLAINVISNLGAASGGGVKLTNPAKALEALEDSRVILVDIRSKAEIKAQGTPDLKSVKRSAVSLPYTSLVKGEYVVDERFAEKLLKVRGVNEETIVILLDADGSESKDAAKVIEGVDKVYILQGGAEAWAAYGAWKEPGKGLSLLPDLKGMGSSLNSMAEDFKEAPSLNKAGIALGAVTGAGLFLVNEAEVLLELAGLVAAGNFAFNLLFSDSRKKTMDEIKEIVDEKVAVKEIGSDLNKIAAAIVDDSDAEQGEDAPAAQAVAESAAQAVDSSKASDAAQWIQNWKENQN